MISRIGSKDAITLIEVMIAVIILTVGIVGIIQAFMKSLDALQVSRDYLVEAPLAQSKMADMRLEEIGNNGLSQTSTNGEFQSPYEHFNWQLEINPSDMKGLNTVKIKCFNNNALRSREFVLISYAKDKQSLYPH